MKLYPDDTFIVSYPRSGNTWMCFLLGDLLWSTTTTFANLEQRVPDIYKHTEAELEGYPRPRYLKSHSAVDPGYAKVIYMVRDPRDVAVSFYYYLLKNGMDPKVDLNEFVSGFLRGVSPRAFGNWGQAVGHWSARVASNPERMILVRYEDMLSDCAAVLSRVVGLLGLKVKPRDIAKAVKSHSFAELAKAEQEHGKDWVERGVRQDIPSFRKGQAGQWRTELGSKGAFYIQRFWGQTMKQLGYL